MNLSWQQQATLITSQELFCTPNSIVAGKSIALAFPHSVIPQRQDFQPLNEQMELINQWTTLIFCCVDVHGPATIFAGSALGPIVVGTCHRNVQRNRKGKRLEPLQLAVCVRKVLGIIHHSIASAIKKLPSRSHCCFGIEIPPLIMFLG